MSNLKNVKAIIFDMDGVVITTCELHEAAWKSAGKVYGYPWPGDINFKKDVFGTVSADSARLLFGQAFSASELQRLIEAKDHAYDELLFENVTRIVVPGFFSFLSFLKDKGYRLALATSSRSSEAKFVLNKLNILQKFDVVVDISQVKNAKPDPEIYLTTLKKLNLNATECIAYEDSLSGVKAVRSAGIPCVLVKTTMDEEKVAKNNLTCVLAIENFLSHDSYYNQDVLTLEPSVTL